MRDGDESCGLQREEGRRSDEELDDADSEMLVAHRVESDGGLREPLLEHVEGRLESSEPPGGR